MKKRNMIRAFSLILCICALALTSCGKKLSVDGEGHFFDKNSGVKYERAPLCYEAIAVSEDKFAKYEKQDFYPLSGKDTSIFLCDSFGTVYYSTDMKLPTLKEMNISHLSVVEVKEEDTVINTVSDEAVINELKELYENGETAVYPGTWGYAPTVNLRLKFADNENGIYYVLAYYEYAEDFIYEDVNGKKINYGKTFLHNRGENICLAIDKLPAGVFVTDTNE